MKCSDSQIIGPLGPPYKFPEISQARRLVFAWVGSFSLETDSDVYILMLTVSHKIKLTVIAEDFSVEVDRGVILMPSSTRI